MAVRVALRLLIIAAALLSPGTRAGDYYLDLSLVGSELSGPALSAESDTGLYRGLGLAASIGHRSGPLRLELEWMRQQVTILGHGSDAMDVDGLFVNAYLDGDIGGGFSVFIGVGLGRAGIRVNLETCLEPAGCPVPTAAHDSGSAGARQMIVGVAWSFDERAAIYAGFRFLHSGDLGLLDDNGIAFGKDRLNMDMSFIGVRW